MSERQTEYEIIANLALELISSAFGRGQEDAGPDDPRIMLEARAIRAIRRGDQKGIARALSELEDVGLEEAAELERTYGRQV